MLGSAHPEPTKMLAHAICTFPIGRPTQEFDSVLRRLCHGNGSASRLPGKMADDEGNDVAIIVARLSDSMEVVDLCSEVPHLRWTKGGFARSSTSTWTRFMRRWSNAKDFSLVNHPTSAKSRRATNSEIAEGEAWTSV